MRPASPVRPDPWQALARLTPARIALGRAGGSLPTRALLEFQLAHAQARDAVLRDLDVAAMAGRLAAAGFDAVTVHSAAPDRRTYIARPDLGRILSDDSRAVLEQRGAAAPAADCVFVVADGLSARAVEAHALPLLEHLVPQLAADAWTLGPMVLAQQARVAIGDEIGTLLAARMTVLLVGERPGLSSPDSLGVYLTYDPVPGRTNAERNCISNVRPPQGLSYALAAHKLYHLMRESRRRCLSGVDLKEDAPALPAGELRVLPAP